MDKNFKKELSMLLQIFVTFAKIGPVTFGGGYAMIPLIEKEVVEKKGWVKESDIADVFAISESIPGAIAINSSTFVGFKIKGIPGAIAAMLGILLPTFLIVLALCIAFLSVQGNPHIEAAFKGIRAAIVALITYAGIKIGHTGVIDKSTLLITIGTMLLLMFFHMNPILIILCGAFVGISVVQLKKVLGIKVMFEKEREVN